MNEGNWNENNRENSLSGLDPTSANSQDPYQNQQDLYQRYQQGAYQNQQQNAYQNSQQSTYQNQQQSAYQNQSQQQGAYQGYQQGNRQSSNNMYQFQNANAGQTTPYGEHVPKKKKKSGGIGRTIVVAAVFGVVAAACFFGLLKMAGVQFSSGRTANIGQVDPLPISQVQVVSGSSAGVSDVSGIVDGVMPSIVAITESSTVSSYFGQTYSTEGAGSGFIVKEDNNELLIVTNNHVVEGADSITVTFIDESTAKGTVKGLDSTADLAVIAVDLSTLKDETKQQIKVANLGHSDDVKVGQLAIAIGNALGYGQSVTVGYISAKNREVTVGSGSSGTKTMTLLQTDAAINPGNSGGALLDANGNVIGINSVKYADTKVEGIGYAIPITDAIPIINELMNREVLKDEERGYLGISGRTISEDLSKAYGLPVGVYISRISENGAAKKAGMQQGDIITKINDVKITSIKQVQEKVNNTKTGTEITVTVARNENGEYKERDLKVVLEDKKTLNDLDNDSDSKNSIYDQSDLYDDYDGSQIMPW